MKNDNQSLQKVLCPGMGCTWEITISMNPSMKLKLLFMRTGNIIGDLFSWNHIPQQNIQS